MSKLDCRKGDDAIIESIRSLNERKIRDLLLGEHVPHESKIAGVRPDLVIFDEVIL